MPPGVPSPTSGRHQNGDIRKSEIKKREPILKVFQTGDESWTKRSRSKSPSPPKDALNNNNHSNTNYNNEKDAQKSSSHNGIK